MYTETELREALQRSARRADQTAEASAPGPPMNPVDRMAFRQPSPRRQRVAWSAAAAAAVLAVAIVSVLVEKSGPSHHPATGGPAAQARASVDLTGAVDLVHVRSSGAAEYQIGGNGDAASTGGSETVRRALGRGRGIVVDVVPRSSSRFDETRIPRARTVSIAGTTGYYSLFKLYPLDADSGPGSDKYLPHWTIAFRNPSGDWVFAQLEKSAAGGDPDSAEVSVDDPAAIATAYDDLNIAFTPNRSRLAFRAGYLPDGLRLADASVQTGATEPGYQSVTLVSAGRSVDIDLFHTDAGSGPQCVDTSCGSVVSKQVGNLTVQVTGRGYPAAATQQILDGLTVASDPADPSTYWNLVDALG